MASVPAFSIQIEENILKKMQKNIKIILTITTTIMQILITFATIII